MSTAAQPAEPQATAETPYINRDIAYFTLEVARDKVPGGIIDRHVMGVGRLAFGETSNTWLIWCWHYVQAREIRAIYEGQLHGSDADPTFQEIQPEEAMDRVKAAVERNAWYVRHIA